MERANAFKYAREHALEEFAALGVSLGKTAARVVTRPALCMVLQPLAKYILRKTKVLQQRELLLEGHAELTQASMACDAIGDIVESERIMSQMEELLSAIDDTEKPLAFRERAAADMPNADQDTIDRHQWRYFTAADFCDLWAEIHDAAGNVIGRFCSFYVCLRLINGTDSCGTVIASKVWDRLKDDPLASGQRYYCNCCNARYKHENGSLLEIQTPGCVPVFCRATNPPYDNQDVKAMYLEDELDPSSPEDLYSRIPEALPFADGTFIRQALKSELHNPQSDNYGVYRIVDVPSFKRMKRFPWEQMFGLFGMEK